MDEAVAINILDASVRNCHERKNACISQSNKTAYQQYVNTHISNRDYRIGINILCRLANAGPTETKHVQSLIHGVRWGSS